MNTKRAVYSINNNDLNNIKFNFNHFVMKGINTIMALN